MMQHIRSKRIDWHEPSINELCEADLGTSVNEKNEEDEAKDPPIFDTVEVEEQKDSVIHEEGC